MILCLEIDCYILLTSKFFNDDSCSFLLFQNNNSTIHCFNLRYSLCIKFEVNIQFSRLTGRWKCKVMNSMWTWKEFFRLTHLFKWSNKMYFTLSDISCWESFTNLFPSVFINLRKTLFGFRLEKWKMGLTWGLFL